LIFKLQCKAEDKHSTATALIVFSVIIPKIVDHFSQRNRHPGRPRNRWVDQIRRDNNLPPADIWRRVDNCGHRGRCYGLYRL